MHVLLHSINNIPFCHGSIMNICGLEEYACGSKQTLVLLTTTKLWSANVGDNYHTIQLCSAAMIADGTCKQH